MSNAFDSLKRLRNEVMQYSRYIYFRSVSAAEDFLRSMKVKLDSLGNAGKGFYDALHGLYVAATSDDKTSLYCKVAYSEMTPEEIEAYRSKLLEETYRETADEYERGFLMVWEAVLAQLAELKKLYPPKVEKPPELTFSKSLSEVLRSDESIEIKPRKKPKYK